jgi:hypothetical protein
VSGIGQQISQKMLNPQVPLDRIGFNGQKGYKIPGPAQIRGWPVRSREHACYVADQTANHVSCRILTGRGARNDLRFSSTTKGQSQSSAQRLRTSGAPGRYRCCRAHHPRIAASVWAAPD